MEDFVNNLTADQRMWIYWYFIRKYPLLFIHESERIYQLLIKNYTLTEDLHLTLNTHIVFFWKNQCYIFYDKGENRCRLMVLGNVKIVDMHWLQKALKGYEHKETNA